MANRNDEPLEVANVNPTWLTEHQETDDSLASMAKYRIVPRLKIVQGSSDGDLKDAFGEGTVIVSPGNVVVAERGTSFNFVPLFFYSEFMKWADIKDRGATNAIVERNFDPTSPLAKLCKNFDTMKEPYDDDSGFMYTNSEHLNFVGVIYGDHPFHGTEVGLTFARGEFNVGQGFVSSIFLRKVGGRTAPLWANVFSFATSRREKGAYKWWGFDITNPDSLYIDETHANQFRAQHEDLKAAFEKRAMGLDYSDEGGSTSSEDEVEL